MSVCVGPSALHLHLRPKCHCIRLPPPQTCTAHGNMHQQGGGGGQCLRSSTLLPRATRKGPLHRAVEPFTACRPKHSLDLALLHANMHKKAAVQATCPLLAKKPHPSLHKTTLPTSQDIYIQRLEYPVTQKGSSTSSEEEAASITLVR